ncbi:SufE family protein [Psychrosphaera ytuae]|uniref:SufE family protein n=1 Tax=Psychrosphaera ytuae TaxID=2820710 RepID=A0A975DBC9_9GAMM|nr:SufE family protein [Psychrosphaera ytuae]QTH63996.1 SufE family protein [Psychrosphaera ytuae]
MNHVAPAELQQSVVIFADELGLTADDIVNQLSAEQGWQNKYRRIMLLGKTLPVLDDSFKNDLYQVQGCESQVWLTHSWQGDRLKLAASSDAKIVKGLIAIVLAAYNNKTRNEVEQFNVDEYLDGLGLIDQLSPSRGNGIKAIIEAIRAF